MKKLFSFSLERSEAIIAANPILLQHIQEAGQAIDRVADQAGNEVMDPAYIGMACKRELLRWLQDDDSGTESALVLSIALSYMMWRFRELKVIK